MLILAYLGLAAVLGTSAGGNAVETGEERFARWSQSLLAPCCYSEPLAAHRSPKADEARRELSSLIQQELSDDEILHTFVMNYGDAVLIVPDGARGSWLFAIPVVFAVLAVAVGVLVLKRMLGKGSGPDSGSDGPELTVDNLRFS